MPTPRSRSITSLLLCAGALAASAAMAQQPAPSAADAPAMREVQGDGRHGTFKTIQGDVTVVGGNKHRAAVVGGGLHMADRIVTGPDSTAAVVLKDGTILSIGPDSSVDLSQFEFNTTTHEGNMLVSLAQGSLRMVTGLIAKLQPEKVQVTTPTSVIGVRGTDFIVEANNEYSFARPVLVHHCSDDLGSWLRIHHACGVAAPGESV